MPQIEGEIMAITNIKNIEKQVKGLDRDDLSTFRDWFRKYDSDAWDLQIERDVRAGKLEKLARQAVKEQKAGKIRAL